MKAYLMYRDRDFDLDRPLPANHQHLTQDLELTGLFDAMAQGDAFLLDVVKKGVLSSLVEPQEIVYRQHVLRDCLEHPVLVREIYAIALQALDRERKIYRSFFRYPEGILRRAIEVLQMFMGLLKRLTEIADGHAAQFRSEGFTRFFAMLKEELDDEYPHTIETHLRQLRFRRGVLVSARLGKGNKGVDYVLRKPKPTPQGWRLWWTALTGRSTHVVVIADRDENGIRALSELRDRGVNLAANALARSADHILSFFAMLRAELGFYVGALNLSEQLARKSEPLCFPEPVTSGNGPVLTASALYDVCLSLSIPERPVANDVNADGKSLVMITGANQGGKSTFLRSIGLAQVMMQAGLFVAAESFRANVCPAIFTHFKREEDPTMKSGKLDEELARMSEIADRVSADCVILFNESFSATNEREGAEIAEAIVRVLTEAGIKVLFVTHSFELARRFHVRRLDSALFLQAERLPDGRRTFKIGAGEPKPTSYGEDLYEQVFGERPAAAAAPPA